MVKALALEGLRGLHQAFTQPLSLLRSEDPDNAFKRTIGLEGPQSLTRPCTSPPDRPSQCIQSPDLKAKILLLVFLAVVLSFLKCSAEMLPHSARPQGQARPLVESAPVTPPDAQRTDLVWLLASRLDSQSIQIDHLTRAIELLVYQVRALEEVVVELSAAVRRR
jgi:hypothetical protein